MRIIGALSKIEMLGEQLRSALERKTRSGVSSIHSCLLKMQNLGLKKEKTKKFLDYYKLVNLSVTFSQIINARDEEDNGYRPEETRAHGRRY
jgi:hypothetical protein